MDRSSTSLLAVLAFVTLYSLYRRFSRISISQVPGPKPESFLLGNLPELFQSQAGEADFKWQAAYGDVVRFKAAFGEDRLLISDPKALQYIYQTSGYHWHKQLERRELSRLTTGKSILYAEGDDHKRHRKVMLPGFGGPESRAFIPAFNSYAALLTSRWKDIIANTPDQSAVLGIPRWLSRALLDAIGEVAFDYQFGVMDNAHNDLGNAYFGLLTETFGSPSNFSLFMLSIWGYMPGWLIHWFVQRMRKFEHARYTERVANNVAKHLIEEKAGALVQGQGKRDIMSLLVTANASENVKTQLSEEEMLSQMRTMMIAGHETTANTLSWTLWELANHPDIQHKLRTEIRSTAEMIRGQGRTEFGQGDFDKMSYTSAVIKEVLRLHPVSYNNFRQAGHDDVLPLSKPIMTIKGELIHELPVPKGLKVVTSIAGYNRNKDIFGEDSHSFNPERWLNGTVKKGVSIGTYANLLTFAGGIRSCIGWRFAVLELHAFLVELINNFEFSITPEAQKIRREACLVMVPTIEGEVEKGAQLPLRVSIAPQDDELA